MVDLKRIEQVLLILAAPESKANVSMLFDSYRSNNLMAFSQGMNTFNHFFHGDDNEVGSVAMCCFIAGVFMGAISEKEECKKMFFDDVIEHASRIQGEHITDMAMFKASKKP